MEARQESHSTQTDMDSEHEENYCETWGTEECRYTWSPVELEILPSGRIIRSPYFFSSILHRKFKWFIIIKIEPLFKQNQVRVEVCLNVESSESLSLDVKWKYGVVDSKFQEWFNGNWYRDKFTTLTGKNEVASSTPRVFHRDFYFTAKPPPPKRKSSLGFCLKITTELSVVLDRESSKLSLLSEDASLLFKSQESLGLSSVLDTGGVFQVPECHLQADMRHLFRQKLFSDVCIVAPDKEFHVHKAILASRSPVFAAMFKPDTEEALTDTVRISDIQGQVIEEMLLFIYTGEATIIETTADKLLAAADKYELKRLKGLCEKTLHKQLSVENAANALQIADMHSCENLKREVVNFIASHPREVMCHSNWEDFRSSKPQLASEVLQMILFKLLPLG